MKFLANAIKEVVSPKVDVIPLLKAHLSKPLKDRSHKEIHASDLTKEHFCPRAIALMDILKLERKPQIVPPAMVVTFEMGEVVADLVRERWLKKHAVGHWKCHKCGAMRPFCKQPQEVEPAINCNHLWQYVEVRFTDPAHSYSGGIDILLDLGAPKLILGELKTLAADEFNKLAAPLAEHRLRTNLYLNLVENSNSQYKDLVNTKVAKILYVSRGYGKKWECGETLPFKEYDIARDDADLKQPLGRALAVKAFRENGIMPGFCCQSSYSPEAKSCQVLKACFSGKYTPSGVSLNLQSSVNGVTLNTPTTDAG